ncbi:Amino acid transporter [Tindallia magadiensis]|uniref:Amino acid transporter n=1 Tax=Tindallia magadiensis TaxID=69895 RepID=A0A1I3HU31_9FIRM|nr:amino acid permease [Tindallia magadiensis]SFI39040.1 Amino acid transporter [Tindallia magadiensis]
MPSKELREEAEASKFGFFGGVFTPSLLTILGVIMFLRLSNVVGYAGLWNALLILLFAKAISVITALSISSIATNMRVQGGGAYYLISRSLGVEFGGVIAIFFYIAQAIAVTMYVAGFTEAILSALPGLGLSYTMIATITNVIVFIFVFIGAGWTIRFQYGILAILMLSIVSFFVGAFQDFSPELLRSNLVPAWTPDYSFFTVFALFFPAVTGIMAGVNMSGDLKDPERAIPLGTFASIGFSTLIYAAIAFLLAGSVSRNALVGDGFVMRDQALFPVLIYAGVISATLSSALGSMMGAPRILQAFARDNIFKRLRWFAKGSGKSNEPRRAVILTFLIAQVGVFAGDLNTIAPIITMFFLLTYGTVNLACFYEGRSKNPSFRPTFRFNHWSVAFLGALSCLGVMFLINPIWAVIALILSGGLYFLIARSEIQVKWGDVDGGLSFQVARKALLRLEREKYHPKNWRPSVLVLGGGVGSRLYLTQYACWFTVDSGMVSIAQIIQGELEDLHTRRYEAENILRKFILKERLPAFPVAIVEKDIHAGVKSLLQCHGIGGMRPNAILLGWSKDSEKEEVFYDTLYTAKNMKRSLIIIASKMNEEKVFIPRGAINIWWNSAKNVELMLLLAFMLRNNREWRDHSIRILRPVAPKADVDNIEKEMQDLLVQARIDAEIVIMPTDKPFEAVRRSMTPSAILFAGFEPVEDDEEEGESKETTAEKSSEDTLIETLHRTVDLPGDVVLVYNAGEVSVKA